MTTSNYKLQSNMHFLQGAAKLFQHLKYDDMPTGIHISK